MKSFLEELYNCKKSYFFLGLIVFLLFISIIQKKLFFTENLYYQTYGEQLSIERIDEMWEVGKQWEWIGYLLLPVIILLRVSFTALCLYTGLFFGSHQDKSFGACFNIALKADMVFAVAAAGNLIYFLFAGAATLADLSISPFSLLFYVYHPQMPVYLNYPLALVNVFEILYWLLLAAFVAYAFRKTFAKGMEFVFQTYGVGLLLWVLVMILITM